MRLLPPPVARRDRRLIWVRAGFRASVPSLRTHPAPSRASAPSGLAGCKGPPPLRGQRRHLTGFPIIPAPVSAQGTMTAHRRPPARAGVYPRGEAWRSQMDRGRRISRGFEAEASQPLIAWARRRRLRHDRSQKAGHRAVIRERVVLMVSMPARVWVKRECGAPALPMQGGNAVAAPATVSGEPTGNATGPSAREGPGRLRPASQETCHRNGTRPGRGAPEKERNDGSDWPFAGAMSLPDRRGQRTFLLWRTSGPIPLGPSIAQGDGRAGNPDPPRKVRP